MNYWSLYRIKFRYVMIGIGFLFLIIAPTLGNDLLASAAIACIGIVLLLLLTKAFVPADEFRFLVTVCIFSFLIRAFLAFALHPFAMFFGPDAAAYDRKALSLAEEWKSGQFALPMKYGGYTFLVAVIYRIFGHVPIGAKIVNSFLGVLTTVFIYLTTRDIYGKKVARIAFLLSAFFPSLVLWSALMLKDTLAVFLIVLAIWSTVRLHSSFRVRYIVILIGSIAYYTQIRWFLVPYMGIAILSSFLVRSAHGVVRNLFIGTLVFALLVLAWQYAPDELKKRYEGFSVDLESINEVRGGFAVGGSEFLGDVRMTSYTEALRFLPLGLLYFFLGPFPWQVYGVRQLITIPEMLIWYCLIPFMIYGFLYTLKNVGLNAYVIIAYVCFLTLAYTYGMTNLGALYRYRSQMLVFYFMFAAVGIAKWRNRDMIFTAQD